MKIFLIFFLYQKIFANAILGQRRVSETKKDGALKAYTQTQGSTIELLGDEPKDTNNIFTPGIKSYYKRANEVYTLYVQWILDRVHTIKNMNDDNKEELEKTIPFFCHRDEESGVCKERYLLLAKHALMKAQAGIIESEHDRALLECVIQGKLTKGSDVKNAICKEGQEPNDKAYLLRKPQGSPKEVYTNPYTAAAFLPSYQDMLSFLKFRGAGFVGSQEKVFEGPQKKNYIKAEPINTPDKEQWFMRGKTDDEMYEKHRKEFDQKKDTLKKPPEKFTQEKLEKLETEEKYKNAVGDFNAIQGETLKQAHQELKKNSKSKKIGPNADDTIKSTKKSQTWEEKERAQAREGKTNPELEKLDSRRIHPSISMDLKIFNPKYIDEVFDKPMSQKESLEGVAP